MNSAPNKLTIRQLQVGDEAAFLEGVKSWEGESLHWHTFCWKPDMKFEDMLQRLSDDHRGLNLPDGFVPHTMLYGFLNQTIIGRISIRHTLNENLLLRGGHIGYSVAPKFRGQRFATQMIEKALSFCKQTLALEKILITCDDQNKSSWKIIEAFGGQLENKFFDEKAQETVRRYWLELK